MRAWYSEVHRRGLWQAAAGYAAFAWAVVEVIDLLTSRDILPDWTFRGALLLLAVGLPVILVTAWLQTPPGSEDAGQVAGHGAPGQAPRPDDPSDPDGARLSALFTWRNAILGGVGAFALLGVVTAMSALLRVTGATPGEDGDASLDPNRIAVLPFEVRGSPELAYLSEGIVDLLSAKLDGAGALTAVDPRAVIARVPASRDPLGPDESRAIAASLRAGHFVTGDLVEVGGRVRMRASLHDTGEGDAPYRQASVEGTADEIFPTLDDLVSALIAESFTDDADRMQALATRTTESLEAAKEYLRGEQLLRGGKYREAATAYDRAVDLDSTFALAWYRKTIAADWTDAFDIRSSADRAAAHAQRLSERDRRLLEAMRLRRRGDVDGAEQAMRAQLHVYPDDVEALVQYAELLFHDVPRRGRSVHEAMVPFRRALDLEPGNLIAHLHLARLYALADSTERLAETAAWLSEHAPDSERAVEVDALVAWATEDTLLQRSVLNRLAGHPWYFRFYAVHGVGRFARDSRGALDILRDRESDDPYLVALLSELLVAQGRRADALALLAGPRYRGEPSWNLYEAFLRTSGLVPVDETRLEELAERLEGLKPDAIQQSAWLQPYEDMTPGVAAFRRDYWRALVLLRLGRDREAREILAAMRSRPGFEGLGTVKADAELGLEAELTLHAGDRAGALEILRRMEYEVPHAATVVAMPDQSRSRYLRGLLEWELGDPRVAERFLVGLDEPWSPWDNIFRGEVYRLLGTVAETEGRTDEAIVWYTRLVDLWAECDPDLLPARDEVEARRNELARGRN